MWREASGFYAQPVRAVRPPFAIHDKGDGAGVNVTRFTRRIIREPVVSCRERADRSNRKSKVSRRRRRLGQPPRRRRRQWATGREPLRGDAAGRPDDRRDGAGLPAGPRDGDAGAGLASLRAGAPDAQRRESPTVMAAGRQDGFDQRTQRPACCRASGSDVWPAVDRSHDDMRIAVIPPRDHGADAGGCAPVG